MLNMKRNIQQGVSLLSTIAKDCSGLAAVEFAISLPFFLGLTVAGMETANYASTIMQLNQLTIHTADSAARMGEGSQRQLKRIREADINDVFAGVMREGGSLNVGGSHFYTNPGTGVNSVRGNARIWVSSVETVASFVPATPKYRMRWQRCAGPGTHFTPTYGTPITMSNVDGVGPATRLITAPVGGAVMFVETKYYYRPLLLGSLSKVAPQELSYHAAMVVREIRDLTGGNNGVYNVENAPVASC
jgi:Flp pilus assembly protein TadG